MAWRVTETEVREIIDHDLEISMAPFISPASSLTDYVSSKDTDSILSTSLLKDIEKFLAAHYYACRDQGFESKKTGDAAAKFQGEWGKGLESTDWGQRALTLDLTGTLYKLGKGSPLKVSWGGRPVSEQTPYVDRN